MSFHLLALSSLVFVVTLALVLIRPRGVHEAYFAVAGGGAACALGLVDRSDLVRVLRTSHEALLFLVALLLLSKLVERSGFFEWAAVRAALLARGDAHALFRNVFVLGALITATLSLDTTALLLTPLVLAFVKRLALPARPFVLACALVANAGSLLLPVSNLTNLVFASSFHVPFGAYVTRMAAPQALVLLATYGMARVALRKELPARFDASKLGAPEEALRNAIVHRGFFLACEAALGLALVGYFAGPALGVPTYAVTFTLAAGLLAYGLRAGCVRAGDLREVPWGVVPFALGLFVVVQSFAHAGLVGLLARAVDRLPEVPWVRALVLTPAAALAANALNNLPAALLGEGVLHATHAPGAVGAASIDAVLLGVDVGPTLVAFASLATMLVLGVARGAGVRVSAGDLLRAGLWTTPVALAVGVGCLALQSLF